MRFWTGSLALVIATGVIATSAPLVHAQSAAELVAARQLFTEGQELEKKHDYPGALDKFRKVAAIKSTAIVRYHEGFCAEKVGKMIEALDAYAKAQLEGQGDPKQNGAVEAARKAQDALRPRLPRIRVKIAGQQKSKIEIRIDGTPVSAALIDLPIPVDPGKHLVEVTAEGQVSEPQETTVAEKESKELTFDLKDAGAPKKEEPKKEEPKKEEPKHEEPKKEPPRAESSVEPKKEEPKSAEPAKDRFSIFFGLAIGNITPGGQFVDPSSGNVRFVADQGNSDQLQYVGSGLALEGQIGVRPFLPWLGIYVFLQHASLAKSGNTKDLSDFSATTDFFGAGVQFLSHPRSTFSFYGDLSYGRRVLNYHVPDVTSSFTADEPRLKLGLAFRPIPTVTVLGFAWASVGSYAHFKYEDAAKPARNRDEDIDKTASHSFYGLGLAGQFDLRL